jgi:acetyl esterase/lipase
MGRKSLKVYRNIILNSEKRFVSDKDELLFRWISDSTKKSGLALLGIKDMFFYDTRLDNRDFKIEEFSFGQFTTSKNEKLSESAILYTKGNFSNSTDLYHSWFPLFVYSQFDISKPMYSVAIETKLSSINPQQSNYLWGTAELFKWKAYNGKDATSIVYKPENFDPKKKYPMIIYFYEKLSDGLYDYKEPAPIRSAINVPYFVSNGYIIFMPDIEYKIGYPGQSAYDYIVSGARALVKKGWVDSTNMALQGHSWGGYQAAQVATMTKLFKAVWAGAPVANMTSAYGGIRWESGVSRQFQYEKSQSRIGGTLWEKLPLYLENSPLFHLDKVTAPMVIMANDADGAVPWYQGIEMFTALRRLGKKVWMFNYNGEGHGLSQRQDMKDYQIRMQQFFDYMLKGAKPAKWIIEGVPAVKKGKDWGLEIVE